MIEERFRLTHSGYIEEIRKKLWWEVVVEGDTVKVLQRGGPIDKLCVLKVRAKQDSTGPFSAPKSIQEVQDWWGWGDG